jgi:peptide-methionine (S)-S-oxide reductase
MHQLRPPLVSQVLLLLLATHVLFMLPSPLAAVAAANSPSPAGPRYLDLLRKPCDSSSCTAPESILVSGGGFWGLQLKFERLPGVLETHAGYVGGAAEDARFEKVASGTTGHAEAVEVIYNPGCVSLMDVLNLFMSELHDPSSTRNAPQYRSGVYPTSAHQSRFVKMVLARYPQAATHVQQHAPFFYAEPTHQHYLRNNHRHHTCLTSTPPPVVHVFSLRPRPPPP